MSIRRNLEELIIKILEKEDPKDFIGIVIENFSLRSEPLEEAKLVRIWQHIKDEERRRFALLTAWKGDFPKEENEERMKELQFDVRGAGLGFIKLRGYWKNPETNQMESEDSIFVPLMPFDLFVKLLKKYDQYSGIFIDEIGADVKKFGVYRASGEIERELMKFRLPKPEEILSGWSELRGKMFMFEAVDVARGGISKWERMFFTIR